jgi:O-acetyl-ADP-ribose deacetylase
MNYGGRKEYEAQMSMEIRVVRGDITGLNVDAIVNAANTSLLGGGGVDGAIHFAAGPALLEECRRLKGCPTGEARITGGYRLPARWVIHTVGPVWKGGNCGEAVLLASCYEKSLRLAVERNLKSIAFPAISTGAYGYPLKEATEIAIRSVREFANRSGGLDEVVLCCYSSEHFSIYQRRLANNAA